MEEEKLKGGGLEIDWGGLIDDDEPPPELVVIKKKSAMSHASSSEFEGLTDKAIQDSIDRTRRTLGGTIASNLPDKGEKLTLKLKRSMEELERRKRHRLEQDHNGCQKPTKLYSGASNGSQSSFALAFNRKLDGNNRCMPVSAFEKELSTLNRCDNRNTRPKGMFTPGERHRSWSSSRQSPFGCPTSISIDVDKQNLSSADERGGDSSASTPGHQEENPRSSFTNKRYSTQVLSSRNLRRRTGQTLVLLDEEEPKMTETAEQAEKLDERMKKKIIYYPSRDDPESVEICYSDMECLAPRTYLSSTIMNFYIRFLQRPTSPTDRARCDYHFFNTYFYNKLKEAVLTKRDKEALFVKFRRWWKGVNIFQKAYILLPIHESLHWSLVIICIPDKEDESGQIILLHLDSLGLHCTKSICEDIKRFLKEEWNYMNQGEAPQDLPNAEKLWKNLKVEVKTIAVPQQRNEYDCGLFVLFFMERFIKEAPKRLKKKDLAMFDRRWFRPEEASDLRPKIRKLLLNEFRNGSEDSSDLGRKKSLFSAELTDDESD